MRSKPISWIWFWLLAVLLACQVPNIPVDTPTSEAPQSTEAIEIVETPIVIDSDVDKDLHERIFRFVWNTVNRHYVYKDFNGVDWDQVKKDYTPRIQRAASDEEFWLIMAEMIFTLDDEHSAFLNPQEVIEEDIAVEGNLDYTGIGVFAGVSDTQDYGVILFAFPGSPAEAAGVGAHDKILAVDGVDVCCDDDSHDILDNMVGEQGTTVNLRVQSPDGTIRDVDVERQRIQTQLPVLIDVFTPEPDTNIGFIMIPTFWDDTISDRTRAQMETLFASAPLDALIVDVRVNGGGSFYQLEMIMSMFAEGTMGEFKERERATYVLEIESEPVQNSDTIPMVVLISDEAESAAEIFSGTLGDIGRATLVGNPTAGNVEVVFPYDLEDGSRLWIAQETFVPPSGIHWEGDGVQPDIHIDAKWEDFSDDNDPYIEAAITYLLENALP